MQARTSTGVSLSHVLAGRPRLLAACLTTLALAGPMTAQEHVPNVTAEPVRADNYYAAGDLIEINRAMDADVIVAGREIRIAQPVAGDILAAGWRVALSGRADDDVRIAGADVTIDAPVGRDLTIAGGDVALGPHADVGGRSWLTGRSIKIDGVLNRDVRVAAATVTIAGEVRRPIQVVAEKLEIQPSARILAPLTYQGPNAPVIGQGAIVNGPITYERIPRREAERARAFPTASTLLFSFHVFLAGLLVVVFLPRVETSVVETLRAEPGRSLLAGSVLLVTVPVAAILLILSVVGLPIGLVLGALYAAVVFAGVVGTALFVGDAEARLMKIGPIVGRRLHVLLLLAGVLTLAVLRSALGGVIVFISVLFGVGALTLAMHHSYIRQPRVAAV